MFRHKKSSWLSVFLVLILAFGPLQAQSLFACAMMDTVIHGECCCDDHKTDKVCVDSGCDGALNPSNDPCCERSIELSVNKDVKQNTPNIKPTEMRSGVDSPQATVTILFPVIALPLAITVRDAFQYSATADQSASDTYLITQRLRI